MVNVDVKGTAFGPITLPLAAGVKYAAGAVSRGKPLLLMP
jgi:hypothetical protein